MKLIFKLLKNVLFFLFISASSLWGRDIIVITYDKNRDKAELLYQYINRYHQVPKNLLKLRLRSQPCLAIRNAIYQICIKNNGDFSFPIIKQDVLVNSFSIFKEGFIDTKKALTTEGL